MTPKERGVLKSIAASVVPMIRVDELAAAMVDIAVNAGEKGMWENRDLVEKGREVLGEKR